MRRSRSTRLVHVIAVLTAAALPACRQDATQLVVFVATDFPVGQLDAFGVRVVGLEGEVDDRGRFELPPGGTAALPASFGVAPKGGDPSRQVLVEIDAVVGDAVPFTTRARTSFIEHQAVRLDLFLARRCRYEALDCPSDQTCGPEGCVPIDVPPDSLRSVDDPPDPPRPSAEWSVWSDTASAGDVAVDETGAAFVLFAVGLSGHLEIGGVDQQVDPIAQAVLVRVDPDGSPAWLATARPASESGTLSTSHVVASGDRVWVLGSTTDGLILALGGQEATLDAGPAAFVLQVSRDGTLPVLYTRAAQPAMPLNGVAPSATGELVIASATSGPGSWLDAPWEGAQDMRGLLLRLDPEVQHAEACLSDYADSVLVDVAQRGTEHVAVGDGAAADANTFVYPVAPGCPRRWSTRLDGAIGVMSVASAAGQDIGVAVIDAQEAIALVLVDSETGDPGAGVPFEIGGNRTPVRVEMDTAGRMVCFGAADGTVGFPGVSAGLDGEGRMGGFLLGVGPALEGRWIRRLESSGPVNIWRHALDPGSGAVVFAARGSGVFSLGGQVLGDRGGTSVLVHRFVP